MPRELHRLNAKKVMAIDSPGRHADGGSLYLNVAKPPRGQPDRPCGPKTWVFLFKFRGRQREMGLGSAGPGGISLADARQRAAEARSLIQRGVDPLDAKRAAAAEQAVTKARATTFGVFADAYVADHEAGWSNDKHRAQWRMTLGPSYCAAIRGKPISEVGVDDVLAVLTPVWQKRPETARRVRMRLEAVLDAARVRGLRDGENPARWRGNLDHLLPRHRKETKANFAAMPYADVPAFWRSLDLKRGTAALCLKYLIATGARTGEALGARWDEIDLEAKVWTLPARRMKAGREHRVPLSDAALAALNAAKGLHPEWCFPGPSLRAPLSNMAMLGLLKRVAPDVTVHGFRSAFRDWASEETGAAYEVAEAALAHVVGDRTERAYRRGDLFEKRRELMAAWSAYLSGTQADVVPLRTGTRGGK